MQSEREPREVDDTLAKAVSNELIQDLLARVKLWFVPIVNPDGYELLRQNFENPKGGNGVNEGEGEDEEEADTDSSSTSTKRSSKLPRLFKNARKTCTSLDSNGVNLLHNWATEWDTYLPERDRERKSRAYEDPCDPNYHGPKPFSEPEVVAVRDLMKKEKFRAAVIISEGNEAISGTRLLFPYTYHLAPTKVMTKEDVEAFQGMGRVVNEGTGSANEEKHSSYQVGFAKELLNHTVAGSPMDWAFDQAGVFMVMMQLGVENKGPIEKDGIEDAVAKHLPGLISLAYHTPNLPSSPSTPRTRNPHLHRIQKAIYYTPIILGLVLALLLLSGYALATYVLGYDDVWGRFKVWVERLRRWQVYRQYRGVATEISADDEGSGRRRGGDRGGGSKYGRWGSGVSGGGVRKCFSSSTGRLLSLIGLGKGGVTVEGGVLGSFPARASSVNGFVRGRTQGRNDAGDMIFDFELDDVDFDDDDDGLDFEFELGVHALDDDDDGVGHQYL
ncbi:hypothetical protein HK102_000997 [Quaeritorhiza haematococci]|nr:hypothetical protein HK102_000997 [Quaeritorhiza haematococci]